MHSFNALSKLIITFAIITITSHAHDQFGSPYPHHTITHQIIPVASGNCGGHQESNVKTVRNLRTGGQITSINDTRHEQSAASLVCQYGSGENSYQHQNNYSGSTQPAIIIHTNGTQNHRPPTNIGDPSQTYQSFSQTQKTPSAPLAPPPQNPLYSASKEKDPLIPTAFPIYSGSSSMDIESNHSSQYRDSSNSLTKIFNGTCCMNTFKVIAFSAVVVCLFTGSVFLMEQGSTMMTHAGPNAKSVSYIGHADDDRTYFTDDVHNVYSDDDYITYINEDPHQVHNHHHLVPIHTKNKHIINNHYHEVTRYRCEGSGCDEYGWGEFKYGLGIVSIIGTAVGTLFLIVNKCFIESSYY